jgi:hypothetical protein
MLARPGQRKLFWEWGKPTFRPWLGGKTFAWVLVCFCNDLGIAVLHAEVDDYKPQQPSLELLEYLGRYVDEEGQWLDPLEVEQIVAVERQLKDDEVKENED